MKTRNTLVSRMSSRTTLVFQLASHICGREIEAKVSKSLESGSLPESEDEDDTDTTEKCRSVPSYCTSTI